MGWQKPKCLWIATSPWCKQITHLPTQGLCQIPFNIKVLDQGKDIQTLVSELTFHQILVTASWCSCICYPNSFLAPVEVSGQVGSSVLLGTYSSVCDQWAIVLRWGSGLEGGVEEWKDAQQNLEDRWSCQGPKGTLAKDGETAACWTQQRYRRAHKVITVCVRTQGRKRLWIKVQIINLVKHWSPGRRTEPKRGGWFTDPIHRRHGAASRLGWSHVIGGYWSEVSTSFQSTRGNGECEEQLKYIKIKS